MNYNQSTRDRIADMILGLHVETTNSVLVAANFATGGVNTSLFNIYGRIGVKQLFIELTAAADANATQVLFYTTFTNCQIVIYNPPASRVMLSASYLKNVISKIIGKTFYPFSDSSPDAIFRHFIHFKYPTPFQVTFFQNILIQCTGYNYKC